MTTAIKIENVSKQYRLGEVGTGTLSHDLHRVWARLRGKPDPFAKVGEVNNREQAGGEYAWALKDVSFEVEQGEILGIIGRNGAGKSTLLKLLSRVTAPTTGKIKTRGRIASLLEVGTGFHPELTGRENVYLNGAIMGMTRSEISGRLEEIVEFSGCAKYIDTPVKRYSSGMTVRLGFAVAAHLDCEILIVDEVLAVGDAEFQAKCIGKMRQISKTSQRTVLFVSHNLEAIQKLCSTSILMKSGKISIKGSTTEIIHEYTSVGSNTAGTSIVYPPKSQDSFHIQTVDAVDDYGHPLSVIKSCDRVTFRIRFNAPYDIKNGSVVFQISTMSGVSLLLASTRLDQPFPSRFHKGVNQIDLNIPRLTLSAGVFRIGAALAIPNIEYLCDGLEEGVISVEPADVYGAELWPSSSRYLVPMECEWTAEVRTAELRPL